MFFMNNICLYILCVTLTLVRKAIGAIFQTGLSQIHLDLNRFITLDDHPDTIIRAT